MRSWDVVLTTLSNQEAKPRYSRDGVPILSLGYRGEVATKDFSTFLGNPNLTGSGQIGAAKVDISYNLCVDGQYLYYEGTMLNASGSINYNGESLCNEELSALNFNGYYKIQSGENGSNINVLGERITQSQNKVHLPEDDITAEISRWGLYMKANLTEAANGIMDFGNLVLSWMDATIDSYIKEGGAPKEVRDHINPMR